MAASPCRASFGKIFSRSQRAALGAICSRAKRRTAWRISSACADIGESVMAEEIAFLAVAFGHAVDRAPAHFQNARSAVHVLALGRGKKGGVELGGERVV